MIVAGDIWLNRKDQGRHQSRYRNEYNASNVRIHPGWASAKRGYFDIALLYFEDGIDFNPYTDKIKFRPQFEPAIDQRCTVVGWGKTQFVVRRTEDDKITWDQSQHSDQLKYAKVRYRGGRIRAVTIDEKEYEGRKLYADWNEEDGARPLQGDSGGPLVCKNPKGDNILFGLVTRDYKKKCWNFLALTSIWIG